MFNNMVWFYVFKKLVSLLTSQWMPVDELSLCLWGCAFTELPAAVMVCLVLSPSCHGRRGAPYPHDIANIFAAVFSGSQGLALGV